MQSYLRGILGAGCIAAVALTAMPSFAMEDDEAFLVTNTISTELLFISTGDATRPPRATSSCAVTFLDPPYRSGLAASALAALRAAGWLAPDALAVVEIGAREEWAPLAGFTLLDERVYGAARLVFLRRQHTVGDAR